MSGISTGVLHQHSMEMEELYGQSKAFMNHVVNKHSNFEDPLFNKCAHGHLEPRKWLRIGNVIVKFLFKC